MKTDEATIKRQIKSARAYIKTIPRYSEHYKGRGIIICAGGDKYFPGAWVAIKMLRNLKCSLPIQLWYLGRKEVSVQLQKIIERLGVECIDALEICKNNPCRILHGYELKPFALVHSPFEEILLLDADNVPIANPEHLFKTPPYLECGAIFWPRPQNGPPLEAWNVFDVPYRAERGFDTGQMLINKSKVWKALRLTLWYNEYSDFYYQYVDGEKETFHMAFRKLNVQYVMISTWPKTGDSTLYQHDYDGNPLFQHRQGDKWKLHGLNRPIFGFRYESKCLFYLEQLRDHLNGAERSIKMSSDETFVIRCPLDGFSGYGLHSQQIIRDFARLGHFPKILPIQIEEPASLQIPDDIKQRFRSYSDKDWEVLVNPPNFTPIEGKKTIFFTMWESTRLSHFQLQNLKKARVIIVPCEWNANTFSAQGIDSPIEVCPLGIDEAIFYVRDSVPINECIFGAAGNSHISGRTRKGLDEVIMAFQLAFPKQKDVRLKIKTLPESEIVDFRDSRIEISKTYLTQNQLAEWYSSLTCFVSAAKAEAWGLMQHQAMAIGRPVIACSYGGLSEFFDSTVGYCVDYTLKPSDERYSGLGLWAQPSMVSLVECMRRVYNNRQEAVRIGALAATRAHNFTWLRSNRQLLSIINKHI